MNFENPVSNQRKKEGNNSEEMARALRILAQEMNEKIRQYTDSPERVGNILDDECRIDMRSFMTKRGGPYSKEGKDGKRGVLDDEQLVRTHELAWSGAKENWAQKLYGTNDENEILRKWKEKEKSRDGALAEMGVLCVLNKMLGRRFIAVRSSCYDDYENGVDTLILDKETGITVCAFDEVVGLDEGGRYAQKVDRSRSRLEKHGGMMVKYGIAFSRDESGAMKIERKNLPNVPGFCISLLKDDLRRIIENSGNLKKPDPSSDEVEIFRKIAISLQVQRDQMKEKMSPSQCEQIDTFIDFSSKVLENYS